VSAAVAAASVVVDEPTVRAALAEVMDPELPMLSVTDLGIVHRVQVDEAGRRQIQIEILPTFVGCPALELIRSSIAERLAVFGRPVRVDVTFAVPWTTERISAEGRRRLSDAGIAPPGPLDAGSTGGLISLDPRVTCPHCGSTRTVLENAFGPTQCRTIRHCAACRQPFEAIKPV
jgi:ring-1,2-phenylacetyl-CoA epoxidase subunit PaaD